MNDAEATIEPPSALPSASAQLLGWLADKLEDAEKSLKAREQMANTWRGGTDKSWRAAGCRLNKTERLDHADTHSRIAVKCRREVAMFKAVIKLVSQPNDPAQRPPI